MASFTKQGYEEFFIAGSIKNVINDTETVDAASSSVVAEDSDGTDVTSTVLDDATKVAADHPDGGTNNILKIRCQAGSESNSPYKITFYIVTDESNKWEVDVTMKIKEK